MPRRLGAVAAAAEQAVAASTPPVGEAAAATPAALSVPGAVAGDGMVESTVRRRARGKEPRGEAEGEAEAEGEGEAKAEAEEAPGKEVAPGGASEEATEAGSVSRELARMSGDFNGHPGRGGADSRGDVMRTIGVSKLLQAEL